MNCENSYDKRGRTAQVCYTKLWELHDITALSKFTIFSDIVDFLVHVLNFFCSCIHLSRLFSYLQLMILFSFSSFV